MGTVFALANILTQLGFSVIAVILGGSLLHSVNHNCELALLTSFALLTVIEVPLVVAVIIIGILSVLVCLLVFGLRARSDR